MTDIAMRWRRFFSKGRRKADEAVRLSREIREAAAEVVEKTYAKLDGEEQWWIDTTIQKGSTYCGCHKKKA